MTRRALLVGAQTFGLTGVVHDVAAMAVALPKRGFTDIRRCEGPDATRDGIVGAYERLIANTTAGDTVLVYYSGHGGYVWPRPGEADEVARNNRQYIVPTDYREPTGDDFRGITAVELSVLLGRLTEKTRNAVVVLDCCHSGLMSRDGGGLRARQLPEPVRYDLEAHLKRRLDAGLPIALSRPLGNPHAVRLVACAAEQLAYERPRQDGPGNYGVLTDALVRALDEAAGTRMSWSRLMARVRYLVQIQVPHQRPEAEGPSERLLFDVAADDSAGSLQVLADQDGRVRLPGAPLLGVQAGDEFVIMPASASGPAEEGRIATVRIDRCVASAAAGPLELIAPATTLPIDARAYRIRAMAPRVPVRVPMALVPAVEASTFVSVAGPGEPSPLDVVVAADGAMTVHDRTGPLHDPRKPGPATDAEIVADLNRIGRATALRGIREESGWTFAAPVTLGWGRVRDGKPQSLELSGAAVDVGDRVYVKVRNDGRQTLYVSLLDIGVSYRIGVLTSFAPSGVRVAPGAEYLFGWDDRYARLTGVPLTWPGGLDPGYPRPETVLVLLTSEPQDVSVLEQRGVRRTHRAPSPLHDMLAHLGAGATRDLGELPGAPARYCVRSIEFDLVPDACSVRQ